jgi:hypothetical protein
MPTPLRHMRIDDELWSAAMAKAEIEGRSVSEVVRELLERWVKRPARR